ncbi:MAG: adenylate/guanylate cyclase domain-containing protein [Dehalococcoidia bacterium]|nr:adenylate/guanylate cyclase domain-containing protein [Dehalococcoidia bacterium]
MPVPPIRYARTSDDVFIAYCVDGAGAPALMLVEPLFADFGLYWPWLMAMENWPELTRKHAIGYLSWRGFGLSDRETPLATVEDRLRDIDAVLDQWGVEKVPLWCGGNASATGMLYATERPERVSSLVLYNFWPGPADRTPGKGALSQLLEANWDYYLILLGQILTGIDSPERGREFTKIMAASATRQQYRHWLETNHEIDVAALIPRIQAPTLVIAWQQLTLGSFSPLESARRLAAGIPNARLSLLPGNSYLVDEMSLGAASRFTIDVSANRMGPGATSARHDPPVPPERSLQPYQSPPRATATLAAPDPPSPPATTAHELCTILFTDIKDNAAMMLRLGDQRGRQALRDHERLTRDALRAHGGTEVKAMGEGFLLTFPSAARALECAVHLQRGFASHPDLQVRIGINAGEPIAEDGDLFGTAVITAARLCGKAGGGEILLSNVVRELTAGRGFTFEERGQAALRGLDDPVKVFALQWTP